MYRRYCYFLVAWVLLVSFPAVGVAIETPRYEVIETLTADIEIRRYEPMLVAVKEVGEGQRGSPFSVLANYIFGGNARQQKIAMTAPVMQMATTDGWRMAFMMPSQYTLASLPSPDAKDIAFEQVPEQVVAVIRFSGWATAAQVMRYDQQLRAFLQAEGIAFEPVPILNQYDPPGVPAALRTNEIHYRLPADYRAG